MKKLLQDGFLRNQWIWFHGLGGGILAWFIPVRAVLVIAILWEIVEMYYLKLRYGGVEKRYRNKAHFLRDSFGDITFALMIAEIVKLYPYIQHLIHKSTPVIIDVISKIPAPSGLPPIGL